MTVHFCLDPAVAVVGCADEAPTSRRRRRSAAARLIAIRLATAVFVLWAAVTVTFLAVHLAPGDTVSLLLGENRDDPLARAAVVERWGLDQPVWAQYLTYLQRIPSGDFGTSYVLRRPVGELIAEAMAPTFKLAALAGLGMLAIGFVVAYISTTKRRGVRPVSNAVQLVFLSAPPFWLAIVLLAIFSFQLGWFSVVDADSWQGLVLPVAAIAIPCGFYFAQVLSEGIDRAMEQPFALTARTRGLGHAGVRYHHALRHATLPGITVAGLTIGSLLGGAVFVETVFGRPGLGQVAVSAVTVKDVPLILGAAIVTTAAYVIASTAVDIFGILLDPRLRGPASA
ncbi:MAG: ABC transporter permease [Bifidobacteriaceae bacterium]|jgi:peptide/nickel transport system permease protein|nr:ABC transporter permease [Bifidobacteriaceae bacterium]